MSDPTHPDDRQPETIAKQDSDPDGTTWYVIAEPGSDEAWLATTHPADRTEAR